MRLIATVAALVVAFAAGLPVMAQDAAPAGQAAVAEAAADTFTPSHLAAAQEVIRLTESDVIFDDILPRLAEQTRQLFISTNPSLTGEIEDVVNDAALGLVKRRLELSKTLERIWARRLTEDELKQLAQFFGSPLGKKFVENTTTISALSIGAARQWEASLAGAMVEEVRSRMREKGYTL